MCTSVKSIIPKGPGDGPAAGEAHVWMQDTGHRSWKGVSPASIRGQTTALAGVRSLRGGPKMCTSLVQEGSGGEGCQEPAR